MEPFDLLETLRWAPDEGYVLLDRHLQRLRDSAEFFGYRCPLDRIRADLIGAVDEAAAPMRVRLLLPRNGEPRVELTPLQPLPRPLRVGLAVSPIDPAEVLFRHKTTRRECYERHRLTSHDETVLWNPAREATESINSNIVVELDGRRVTPLASCGLLPGTMRAELLARGEIFESRITVEALVEASRFWLINSVRGWQDAVLDRSTITPQSVA